MSNKNLHTAKKNKKYVVKHKNFLTFFSRF